MGFCTEDAAKHFLQEIPHLEALLTKSGIILLKYFLTVGEKEQERRFPPAHRRPGPPVEALADGPQLLAPLVGLHEGP